MNKILLIIGFAFFSAAALFAQTNTPPPPPPPPAPAGKNMPPPIAPNKPADASAVKFNELVHNFGQVAYNSDVKCTFEFKNTSNEPVAIKDVGTSCGCTTPSYSKEPVAPGKTGSVTAKYDSSRIGAFTKTLTVYINNDQIRLMIRGTILPPKSDNTPQSK